MARILGDLTIRLNASGAAWSLVDPIEYHVGGADSPTVVEAPAGFETDLASVPWFGAVAGVELEGHGPRGGPARLPVLGGGAAAARLHAVGEADAIFGEALRVTGSKLWPVIWAAVRVFGLAAWRGREREGRRGVAARRRGGCRDGGRGIYCPCAPTVQSVGKL